METIKGFHGEWNMGSPGGWEYQRMTQDLGKLAWELISETIEVGLDLDYDHPQINAVPGFARMILRAHRKIHGANPVHAVLLAESETLDVVLENRNFVDFLNTMAGVSASLAGPEHLTLEKGKVCCRGREVTVIFMDFNLDVLIKIGEKQDISPIKEAIRQGILVNPKGMEPLGAKSVFEALSGSFKDRLTQDSTKHTPWTRQFFPRRTIGPNGESIAELVEYTEKNWPQLVLKPAHGYSGHGIFVGGPGKDPGPAITTALEKGDYILQEKVPLNLWSERTTWPDEDEKRLYLKVWQTDFRCFITDEGLQGFLARFGGVPTNVGSGGGMQPLAVLREDIPPGRAVDRFNEALMKMGYQAFMQIKGEVEAQALRMGLKYLLGPIPITLRPRILTKEHLKELNRYAGNLWQDAVWLEKAWQAGQLDDLVLIGAEEKELAGLQPWQGGPALMVSDGLFSFGAHISDDQ